MKLHAVVFAVALALTTVVAQAQERMDLTNMKAMASSAEVQALIAKAEAMPPRPLISQNIAGSGVYLANLEYRPIPGARPAVHEKQFELIYVLEGTGTTTVGGTVTADKRSIIGGTVTHASKGDLFVIPPGVPHWSVPDPGVAMALLVVHTPAAGAAQ